MDLAKNLMAEGMEEDRGIFFFFFFLGSERNYNSVGTKRKRAAKRKPPDRDVDRDEDRDKRQN